MLNPPPLTAPESPEETRKSYLAHEASIRSVGSLYLLGCALVAVSMVVMSFSGEVVEVSAVVLAILFAIVQGWVGSKLRKLDPAGKPGAVLLGCIGLFAFPVGTLISGYILYLLLSAKGKFVFSEEYRAVVSATPQIQYKTSKVVMILLVVFVVLVAVTLGSVYLKR